MTPDILPKFRIIKVENKYYVQIKVRKKSFFRSEKWVYCIFWTGTDKPYGFRQRQAAIEILLTEIKLNIFYATLYVCVL